MVMVVAVEVIAAMASVVIVVVLHRFLIVVLWLLLLVVRLVVVVCAPIPVHAMCVTVPMVVPMISMAVMGMVSQGLQKVVLMAVSCVAE